jgi:hypothetical protein
MSLVGTLKIKIDLKIDTSSRLFILRFIFLQLVSVQYNSNKKRVRSTRK